MATRSDNLPAYLPSLIGREGAVAELSARLHESERGVLTLTGAGGSGKTRLALAIALTVRDSQEFEDGVWLVELASVRDPVLVPGAVAAALGIKEHPGKPVRDTLLEQLQPRALLLLFDNCEHVVEACAALVEDVVRNAPRLRILTTSREPLRVPGERVWLVPPLPIPDLQVATEADKLAQNPAVQLFVERAQAVQPSIVLNERTGPSVAAICARLDGLPLALELAAARTTVLTPEQILLRLDDAFRPLIGGSRTAPTRQQTLRAALDWSYRLSASAAGRRRGGVPTPPILRPANERDLAAARAGLPRQQYTAAYERGSAMSIDELVEYAASSDASFVQADPLSERERQVITLLARGYTNRQIAEELVISGRTADGHVAHILSKLGVSTRAQAAAWAVAHPTDGRHSR